MVITDTTDGPRNRKETRIIYDEEIINNSEFLKIIEMTASGGLRFKAVTFDEFDNRSELTIVIEGPELKTIQEIIQKGL